MSVKLFLSFRIKNRSNDFLIDLNFYQKKKHKEVAEKVETPRQKKKVREKVKSQNPHKTFISPTLKITFQSFSESVDFTAKKK